MTSLVSVVMPTFNASAFVCDALDSICAQTHRQIEIVIVDDCSSDETVSVVETYLHRQDLPYKIICLGKNGGPSHARNIGVQSAVGDYVAFLDADDAWLPQKIEKQVALLNRYPDARLCGCQAEWIDRDGVVVEPLFRNLPEVLPAGWKRLLWDCFIATPCAFVRRADLGVRPFDERLRVGEDRDLWIRLATNGKVVLVPDVLVRIRVSQGSYMARHSNLILADVKPMIEQHVARMADFLSSREKRYARGKTETDAGKAMCANPGTYFQGARHLLSAIANRHNVADNLRTLVYCAPGVRNLKSVAKRLKPGRA